MEETRPRDRTMSLKKLEDEMMGAYSKTKSRLVKPKPGAPPVRPQTSQHRTLNLTIPHIKPHNTAH